MEFVQLAIEEGREHTGISALELDGVRYLALFACGKDSDCPAVLREGAAACGERRTDDALPRWNETAAR